MCSPLSRAQQTCALALPDAHPAVDPDLREWNYGDCEGRTAAEIREERPGWSLWDDGVAGGESLGDVAARADRLIARLDQAEGDAVLVAHGHLLRVLASRWIRREPRLAQNLLLSAASISLLGWEHGWRSITLWNSTEHLR